MKSGTPSVFAKIVLPVKEPAGNITAGDVIRDFANTLQHRQLAGLMSNEDRKVMLLDSIKKRMAEEDKYYVAQVKDHLKISKE